MLLSSEDIAIQVTEEFSPRLRKREFEVYREKELYFLTYGWTNATDVAETIAWVRFEIQKMLLNSKNVAPALPRIDYIS